MNELTIFSNPEFGEIRTVIIDGEPWFVGIDIARALGYKRPSDAVYSIVDEGDSVKHGVCDINGHMQQTTVVNESGMYSLIFGSKLDSSKKFKKWVTSEVLPSIRKTGTYSIKTKKDSYMIEDPIERAKRWIEEQEETKELREKVMELKPKGEYFDALVESKLLTNFRDTAKEFHVSPGEFTKWLTEKGYIYKDRRGVIKPYEQYRKAGLFQLKDFKTPYGYSNTQTYITVKGKETFRILMQI